MLVGDVLEVIAALVAAVAVFLIVTPLVCAEVGVGAALLVIAGAAVYLAEVHGGTPVKRAKS